MATRGRTMRARRKTRRTTRRRYTVKTRRSAKRTMRPTNKKRILNITSRKKRDAMLTWSNTQTTGELQPNGPVAGPAYVSGQNPFTVFIWDATARRMTQAGGGSATIVQEAMRTSPTCYMRGLSEHLRIQTNSPAPWIWRRICFKTKDDRFIASDPGDTASGPQRYVSFYENTVVGYTRQFYQLSGNGGTNRTTATYNNILDVLFKGAQGIDFVDFTLAHVDTRRVDLAYDKVTKLASGNDSGVLREFKRWHPMNKNLVYDDDEQGEIEVSSAYSVNDKRGMGNYMVMDIFAPGLGATDNDKLAISSNASLYWHEK